MGSGILAGFPVVDVTCSLYDGSYHDVDSSALAFQIAARGCFREAMTKTGARLLEPIMKVRRPSLLFSLPTRPEQQRPCNPSHSFYFVYPPCVYQLIHICPCLPLPTPPLNLPHTHSTLLPPHQVEVITPEDHMGDVIGDLNSRRGVIDKLDDKPGGMKLVAAFVPLAEMFQ